MYCLAFLGKNPSDEYLEAMMSEAPGPINFTMFLTMFGEKLNGTDPEDVIRNAFACFDEEGTGTYSWTHYYINLLLPTPKMVAYDIICRYGISERFDFARLLYSLFGPHM